jgi:hypothetical protein
MEITNTITSAEVANTNISPLLFATPLLSESSIPQCSTGSHSLRHAFNVEFHKLPLELHLARSKMRVTIASAVVHCFAVFGYA